MHPSRTSSSGPLTRSRARQEAGRRAESQSDSEPSLGAIQEEGNNHNHGHATGNVGWRMPPSHIQPRMSRRSRVSASLRSPLELAQPNEAQRETRTLPSVHSRAPVISSPLSPNRDPNPITRVGSPARTRSPRPPSPVPSPAQRTSSSNMSPRHTERAVLPPVPTLLRAVETRRRQGLQRNFTPAQPLDQQSPQTPGAPRRGRISLGFEHDGKRPSPLGLVVEEGGETEDSDEGAVFQVGMGQRQVQRARPNRELEFLDPNKRPDYRQTKSSAF
ncbi:hypothetical protein VKT23_012721 [Stygiomarasmius scandens]|uniref:Uncharacterized protein n=1 Tax=Marasmiellus scandens TaxID=2682957 RepID=A0ABR1J7P8_9AGAR